MSRTISHVQLMENGLFESGWTTGGNVSISAGVSATLTSPANHTNDAYVEYTLSVNGDHSKDYHTLYLAVDVNSPGGSDCKISLTRSSDSSSVENSSKINGDTRNKLTMNISTATSVKVKIWNSNGDLVTQYGITVKNVMLISLTNSYWYDANVNNIPSADEFSIIQSYLGTYWANGVDKVIDTSTWTNKCPNGNFEYDAIGAYPAYWTSSPSSDVDVAQSPNWFDGYYIGAMIGTNYCGVHAPSAGSTTITSYVPSSPIIAGHEVYACCTVCSVGSGSGELHLSAGSYMGDNTFSLDTTTYPSATATTPTLFSHQGSQSTGSEYNKPIFVTVSTSGSWWGIVDGVMLLDLTAIFGASYIPDRTMVDKIVRRTGSYYDSPIPVPTAPSIADVRPYIASWQHAGLQVLVDDNNPGEQIDSMNIYRSDSSGGTYVYIGNTGGKVYDSILTRYVFQFNDNNGGSGLTYETPYYYKATGVNDTGEGPQGSYDYSTTYDRPHACTGLTASYALDAKHVTFSWNTPDSGGPGIIGYKITGLGYTDYAVGNVLTFNWDCPSAVGNHQAYDLHVYAYTDLDNGVDASITTYTPYLQTSPAVTNIVESVVDGSGDRLGWKIIEETVYWAAFSQDPSKATVTGVWGYRNGANWTQQSSGTTAALDYLYLEPGTNYSYTMRYQSAWGESPDGSSMSKTTVSKPGVVGNYASAFTSGDNGFFIKDSWTEPADVTYVTGYKLFRTPGFTSASLGTTALLEYDDYDFIDGATSYSTYVRPTTNLWSSADQGYGTASSTLTVSTPAAPTGIVIDNFGSKTGNYANIFFNKVIWQIPYIPSPYDENTVYYKIYRSTVESDSAGDYVLIGTTIGRDTVFYDSATPAVTPESSYILPETSYWYKVRVSTQFGDSDSPFVTHAGNKIEILSPSFSRYASNGVGTNGTWKCKAGLYIDDNGYPKISIFTVLNDVYGSPIIANSTIYGEISEEGGSWKLFASFSGDVDRTSQSLWATQTSASIKFGKAYRIRLRSVDNTTKETTAGGISNEISITTYRNDETSFPNMMPNSGLQYGLANSTTIASDAELYHRDSQGTWVGYSDTYINGNVSIVPSDNLNHNGKAAYFYGDNVIKVLRTNNASMIRNISAYKFPSLYNTTRYYSVLARAARSEVTEDLIFFKRKLSGYWDLTQTITVERENVYYNVLHGIINAFPFYDTFNFRGDYADLLCFNYGDNYYTQQMSVGFMTSGVSTATEVFVGDFMMFDLSAVFGGDGGDVIDTSASITSQNVITVLKQCDKKWWDFDYSKYQDSPPGQFLEVVPATVGGTIEVGLQTVDDITGGLDMCGYLPAYSYAVQYKKVGNEFYEEKAPIVFADESTSKTTNIYLTRADNNIQNGSTYQIRYTYSNGYGESLSSDAVYVDTLAVPDKLTGLEVNREYSLGTTNLVVTWDVGTAPVGHAITGYKLRYGTSVDDTNWSEIITPAGQNYSVFSTTPNLIYYCKVAATNDVGYGEYSNVSAGGSCTFPSAPTDLSYVFTDIDGETTGVVFTWNPPEDDGCSIDGESGVYRYIIYHGTDINNLQATELLGPTERMWQPTYTLSVGSECYYKIAAITNYTNSIVANLPGTFSDIQTVKYMVHTETVKIRGEAYNDGYIDFYFTARKEDGTYEQYQNSFWRLTANGTKISEGSNIYTIQALIDNAEDNIYLNGVTKTGWPPNIIQYNSGTMVTTAIVEDIFGEALNITFTLPVYQGYIWDVHTQTVDLDGIGSFLIQTDYTTDVSFYNTNTTNVSSYDIIDPTLTGSLVWTVNASFIFSQYKSLNENVPQVSKEFSIVVNSGDSLNDEFNQSISIRHKIEDPSTGLQKQLNDYFLGNTGELSQEIAEIYRMADPANPANPFVVECTVVEPGSSADGKRHLKVNIRTLVEQIQNQVSCKTTNLRAFYLKTKPNIYYVANQMIELRSFEDMYGRNKPGSSSFSGNFVKRSYGFRFNLEYVVEYSEEELSTLDITPIPGTTSGNAIGLDVVGTTRAITIRGIRVDNSNDWMFHAPFEYVDDPVSGGSGQILQGGVIYMGTSNWGWSKFMKAVMGTFQFIDGPYRFILMTIPSSLMQQYVPDRYCKYQYPDGTYIVQAGTEDMCYVMIERFTTRKSEDMFNAIEYDLVLKRVIPLGSSI